MEIYTLDIKSKQLFELSVQGGACILMMTAIRPKRLIITERNFEMNSNRMKDVEKARAEEIMNIVKVLEPTDVKALLKVAKDIVFVERLRNECK